MIVLFTDRRCSNNTCGFSSLKPSGTGRQPSLSEQDLAQASEVIVLSPKAEQQLTALS